MNISSIIPFPMAEASGAGSRHCILVGVAASPGIAIGEARLVNRAAGAGASLESPWARDGVREEKRLMGAVEAQAAEFEAAETRLRDQASSSPSLVEQADLLDAYSMICRDPKLLGLAARAIHQDGLPAGLAWEKAVRAVLESFENIHVPYLRERAEDVRVVGSRVAAFLRGQKQEIPASAGSGIIIAHSLTPADTLALAPENILGLATEMGGRASHTAILARSQHLPCVVGVTGLAEAVRQGSTVIVDGVQGLVIIDPCEAELAAYREKQTQFSRYEERLRREAALPARTENGRLMAVYGNIEAADEAWRVCSLGGEGVGLYRTEFGYLSRLDLPTEEELYADYTRVVCSVGAGRVVFRTLDVGADKSLAGIPRLEEGNPAMGLRAIRHSLRYQDLFLCQLRAILRAAAHGNAAVMFPLVSGLRELRQAKSLLEEARRELRERGTPCAEKLPVGVMIELPSAVFLASALAREADFFSIGSNDLTQFILGVDRANKYVSYLYQPLHTAVLRAMRQVTEAAHQAGIKVCVCGEMASDPFCIPLLLAMGIDEFSVVPQSIPIVKYMIRRLDTTALRSILRRVYSRSSTRMTRHLIEEHIQGRFSEELQFINTSNETEE